MSATRPANGKKSKVGAELMDSPFFRFAFPTPGTNLELKPIGIDEPFTRLTITGKYHKVNVLIAENLVVDGHPFRGTTGFGSKFLVYFSDAMQSDFQSLIQANGVYSMMTSQKITGVPRKFGFFADRRKKTYVLVMEYVGEAFPGGHALSSEQRSVSFLRCEILPTKTDF